MPLALTVILAVVAVTTAIGVVGYLIDRGARGHAHDEVRER